MESLLPWVYLALALYAAGALGSIADRLGAIRDELRISNGKTGDTNYQLTRVANHLASDGRYGAVGTVRYPTVFSPSGYYPGGYAAGPAAISPDGTRLLDRFGTEPKEG